MDNKYLPATTPGSVRVRVRSATLDNTYGKNPRIVWQREEQILGADGVYRYMPMPDLHTEITPEILGKQIELLDVDTGASLGSLLGAAVVVALSSLFIDQDSKAGAFIGTAPLFEGPANSNPDLLPEPVIPPEPELPPSHQNPEDYFDPAE